jgi:hypothetical protein
VRTFVKAVPLAVLCLLGVDNVQAKSPNFSIESDVPLTKFEESRLFGVINQTFGLMPETLINQNYKIRFRRFMTPKGVRKSEMIEDCPAGIDRSSMARFFAPNEIHLNYELISVLAGGEALARPLKCGHPNLYRAAQGAIVHALGKSLPQASRDQFLNLMGFTRTWYGAIDQKNVRRDRSADAAEFASRTESLAVNLEFYLLDPNYPCRRPAVARYFDQEFGQSKVARRQCAAQTEVYTFSTSQRIGQTQRSRRVDLDPSRIYRVDYALVDPGEGLASGFGHAMFRLVVCAPGAPVDADCVHHTTHHVGIAYLGNMSDPVIDVWGGIFGKYPMQLNVLDWSAAVEAYTMGQLRSVSVYPMKLSDYERSLFVDQVLENYWAYTGRYFFLNRNCATEVQEHVKAVAAQCTDINCSSITPSGVTDDLIRSGVLDVANVEVIESAAERLDQAFNTLSRCAKKGFFIVPSDPQALFELKTGFRMLFYQSALEACRKSHRWLSADAAFVEHLAMIRIEGELAYNTAVALDSPRSKVWQARSDGLTQKGTLQKLLTNREIGFPWTHLDTGGYGVPLKTDFGGQDPLANPMSQFKSWDEFMIELGQTLFSELGDEYKASQQNLAFLTSGRDWIIAGP